MKKESYLLPKKKRKHNKLQLHTNLLGLDVEIKVKMKSQRILNKNYLGKN